MSDPTYDELRKIVHAVWRTEPIEATYVSASNGGLRAIWLAGRASVTPSREALAQAIYCGINLVPGSPFPGWPPPMDGYDLSDYFDAADAVLALLGVVPSTGNKEK